MPRLREHPEDFCVDELPLYPPRGEGEHTFVRVEKRLRTTEQVARDLARACGVPPREVGYAGRKDRNAVTRQWLSVPGLDPARALDLDLRDARVLEAERHPHKLRTGQLRGNRFEILAREVEDDAAAHAEKVLRVLAEHGMPNRFGPQRFGHQGDNATQGSAILRGEAPRTDRRTARLLVSALQAQVFNAVLAHRAAPLGALEVGDVAVVHASGGLFLVEDLAREAPRAERFEISATGPLFGTRMPEPRGAVAERERGLMAALGVTLPVHPPRGIRLRGGRRALRVLPRDVSLEREGDALRLRCVLPSGSYATVLLEDLFPGG